MAPCDECTVKYHHGGSMVREGGVKYDGGKVDEFAVDPDKICHYDLLGDFKKFSYDIKKAVDLFSMDYGG